MSLPQRWSRSGEGGGWGLGREEVHSSTGHCYSRRQHGGCHNGAVGWTDSLLLLCGFAHSERSTECPFFLQSCGGECGNLGYLLHETAQALCMLPACPPQGNESAGCCWWRLGCGAEKHIWYTLCGLSFFLISTDGLEMLSKKSLHYTKKKKSNTKK